MAQRQKIETISSAREEPHDAYKAARRAFRWDIPDQLNLGAAVLDEPASLDPSAIALIDGRSGEAYTFSDLAEEASRLSGALMALGAERGNRVAIIAPQGVRTLIAHVAVLRAGLINVPLSERYGRDALIHRMSDSGARFALVSHAGLASLTAIADSLPRLERIIALEGISEKDSMGDGRHGVVTYDGLMAEHGQPCLPTATAPDDPCLMIYTSGTTGPAKGALHGHRVLAGHMPGFRFAHSATPESMDAALGYGTDAIFYTPADWAWAGGMLNLLFPALSEGCPVVFFASSDRFDPTQTVKMMLDRRVTHAFLPPTALRLIRASTDQDLVRALPLRSVMAAGEALGRTTYDWAEQVFGFPINEAYGQTECNLILGSSHQCGVTLPGATGVPVPGHTVAVVREDGTEADDNEMGEIAVCSPDPVSFLGYWNAQAATQRKYLMSPTLGRLLMTGDMAHRDADGFIWFAGRDDDIITSSGHRIGPGEIENSLTAHPAVAAAAVVGVSDPVRTEIVRAFVVVRDGYEPTDALAQTLQRHVRDTLSAHEYPRDIRFLDALPITTTGKIIRRLLKD
ncbi:MAG: AMP-binding protein [Pseudomonadota bacterium]